jgi:hypothetical protein
MLKIRSLQPALAGVSLLIAFPLAAWSQGKPGFDRSRAWIVDSTIFVPFRPTATTLLRDALASGRVENETNLLVFEERGVRLALVTSQMAYHHVAQGAIAGEPWMVAF